MQSKRDLIPVHRLEESTDQGFQLEQIVAFTEEDARKLTGELHRDDHYIFILLESGKSKMTFDFELHSLEKDMIMCASPGAVHGYYEIEEEVNGWFMALDPGWIPELFTTVLENPFLSLRPLAVTTREMGELRQCLELIHVFQQRPASAYLRHAIFSLLATFTALVTELYANREDLAGQTISRAQHITRAFRKLVSEEFRTLKSPGEYAAVLHLSPSYLNEAVKEATGFTVGYWIQKQIALEAKRLLYYGNCNIKEIAHELGYEDHTYFSRLFKKMVGKTPGAFRAEYGAR